MWELIGILAGVVVIITGVAKFIQWWRRRPPSSPAQTQPSVEVIQGQDVTIYNINVTINNEGREQD